MSRDCRIVVIGHSLRPESGAVVDNGLRFARALGARAEVIHAMTPMREQLRGEKVPADTPTMHARLLKELQADVEGRSLAEGLSVQCHVASGPPDVVLDSVASSLDADVIVVGPAEPGSLGRGALGSSTRKLLRTAHYPVLVVRGELVLPPRLVVAAIDFSRPSMWGLRLAEDLVEALAGEQTGDDPSIELEVFTVLPDEEVQEPLSDVELAAFVARQMKQWVLDDQDDRGAISTHAEVRRGNPETMVLEELHRRRPDLVVVGSSGSHEAHRRDRLGKVARKLALEVHSSVLFVPPAACFALRAAVSLENRGFDSEGGVPGHGGPDD